MPGESPAGSLVEFISDAAAPGDRWVEVIVVLQFRIRIATF